MVRLNSASPVRPHVAYALGYSSLLMPDGMQLLSPLPALALAAGATRSLHVGTFVLASPLRPPALAAWDAHYPGPSWLERFLRVDFGTLAARDSLLILRGGPREMADELQRRREVLGVSYHSVNAAFCDQFAPVLELLAGR